MGRRPRQPPASPRPPPSQSLPALPAPPSLHPLKMLPPNPSKNTAIVADLNATPNPNDSFNSAQSRKLSTFTTFVLNVARRNPDKPLTAARKSLIKKRLAEVFTDPHTPDHPTYGAMIHGAIVALNGKRGSTEESISKFIRNKYNDLPWAHDTFLKHHLAKLCESGEIILTGKNRYALSTTPEPVPPTPAQLTQNPGSRRKKRRLQKKYVSEEGNQPHEKEILMIGFTNEVAEEKNGMGDEILEEQSQAVEELSHPDKGNLDGQVTGEPMKGVEENYEPVKQLKEVLEELDKPNEEDLEMDDLEMQATEEWIKVVEQNNPPLKEQMEVLEEPDQPTKENLGTADSGTQVTGDQIEVLEDKNEPVEQLNKVLEEPDKPNKQIVETAGLGAQVLEESFKVVGEEVTREPLIGVEEKNQIVEQQEEVLEEPDRPSKENLEISGLGNQVAEVPCKVDEEKNKPVEQSKDVLEVPDQPNNGNLKMADPEIQVTEERIEVVHERKLPVDQQKEVLEEPGQSKQVSSIGEPNRIEEDQSEMTKEKNDTKLQNEDQQTGIQEEKQPAKVEKPVQRRVMTRSQQTKPEDPTVVAETDSDLEGNTMVVLAIPATVGQSFLVDKQNENGRKKSVDQCEVQTPEIKPKESPHDHHSQPLPLQVRTRSHGRAEAPSCDSPSGKPVENSENQRKSKRQGHGKLESPQKQQLFKREGRGRTRKNKV